MVYYNTGNKNINVRHEYTDEAVWRKTLGNKEPLLCFAMSGYSMDAPVNLSGGSMLNSQYGARQSQTERY